MWFEATFAFTHLEPWEKTLLLTIGFIISFLVFSAVFRYLPQHLRIMHGRTVYYLYGKQDNASNVDYVARLGQWFSNSFSSETTTGTAAATATAVGSGAGLMQEL